MVKIKEEGKLLRPLYFGFLLNLGLFVFQKRAIGMCVLLNPSPSTFESLSHLTESDKVQQQGYMMIHSFCAS